MKENGYSLHDKKLYNILTNKWILWNVFIRLLKIPLRPYNEQKFEVYYFRGERRTSSILLLPIWDRPFNLQGGLSFFVSFRKKIRAPREFFFVAQSAKREFLFQNLTLGYMTKTLNQIIYFFPPPKSEYFFQQHWE